MLMSMMSAPVAFGDARALRHPVRLAAGELHDIEAEPLAVEPALRVALAFGERRAGDHFGDHDAGAQTRGKAAEGRVGDAGHRREEDAVRQHGRPDGQRLGEIPRRWRQRRSFNAHYLGVQSYAQSLAIFAAAASAAMQH